MVIVAVILVQLLCIYFAYKLRSEFYWYAIILFLPVLGSIIFLYSELKSHKKIKDLQLLYIHLFHQKKRIKKLYKKFEKEDSFLNAIDLAQAYEEKKEYNKALDFYKIALQKEKRKDPFTIKKIIKCNYALNDFDEVIRYYDMTRIYNNHPETVYYYGISLEKQGKLENAEEELKKNDIKYTNYLQRLELSKFLVRVNKNSEAKNLLNEIIIEIDGMMKNNRKKHNQIYLEAKTLNLKL